MKTVVWDADDVLNDLMCCWLRQSKWSAKIKYSDLKQNPPHKLLGITKDQYLKSLDKFRNSEKAQKMRPNSEILRWLKSHGHLCRNIVLTARPLHTVPLLSKWVYHNFGTWVRTFAFVPTRGDKKIPFYDNDKKDYLKWMDKADILIDDSQSNIQYAKDLKIQGLVYPRPWNNSQLSVDVFLENLTKLVKK